MKKITALLSLIIIATNFLLAQIAFVPGHRNSHLVTIAPNSHKMPGNLGKLRQSSSRSSSACDTLQLNYEGYDAIVAQNAGLNFVGNTSPFVAGTLTSFVDSMHVGDDVYIDAFFDTIVYIDASNNTAGIPLSASTIYFDSLGILVGLYGDPAKMLHDSLVFEIYTLTNAGGTATASLAKTIIVDDTAHLAQFMTTPGQVAYVQIPVNLQLATGAGFAVELTYLNKDTSSSLDYLYSYADSCGQFSVILNNQSYPFDGAYPSSLGAVTAYGQIEGTGATASNGPYGVNEYTNEDYYSQFTAAPNYIPQSCLYVQQQDLFIFPIIEVCTNYQVIISSDNVQSCPNATVNLDGNVYGTNSPLSDITYNWSASSGGILTSNAGQTNQLSMGESGNVTVTLTITDGGNGNAVTSDSIVISNNGPTLSITSTGLSIPCNSSTTLVARLSGNIVSQQAPAYYWSDGSTTTTLEVNSPAPQPQTAPEGGPPYNFAGDYTVTVTNKWGCSANASATVSYSSTVGETVNFTAPTTLCAGSNETFTNTSSNFASPWVGSFDPDNTGSNVITVSTGSPYFNNTYPAPGMYTAVLIMDSAGCRFSKSKALEVLSSNSSSCQQLPLTVNLGSNQNVCSGSHIILNPLVSGGSQPYSYSWQSTGNSLSCNNCKNAAVTITENSSYTVTVTDVNHNSATASINYTISGINNIQLSVTNTGLDCRHSFDATVVTASNGNAPYTFNWGNGSSNTGSSTQSNIYNYQGTYIISVSDTEGCVTSVFDTITDNNIYLTVAQAKEPPCNGINNGVIQIAVTGGVGNISYLWSNGSQADSIGNLAVGNYELTVTDTIYCSAYFSYYLGAWSYYVYINAIEPNCGNTGSCSPDLNGGTPPYQFLWSNGATSQNISNLPSGSYSLTVTDNAGCMNYGFADLFANCSGVIAGIAFVDSNNNCTYDQGETPIQGIYIIAYNNNGIYYGYTDEQGQYSINVDETGTYTLTTYSFFNEVGCGNPYLCNNSSQTVTLTTLGDSSLHNNFAQATSSGFDLTLHPGWTSADPGFQKEYWVMPYNQSVSTYTGTATIVFAYDSNLIYQYSLSPLPVNDPVAHTLTWQANNVPSPWWDWDNYRFENFFQVPASLSLNYLLQSDFYIYPTSGDCDSSNNHFHYSESVISSHDPNAKTVQPSGNILNSDSILTYTIFYQNTGTDSTWFIVVRDSLTAGLDPASVRTIASSHPYNKFTVSGKGVLSWTFNPFRLVDSLTNPQGSKGFIIFTVKKRANQPIGTIISNTASVFFDYNPPVITNTVADTVASPNAVVYLTTDNGITVKAFPNPFNNYTNIETQGLSEKYDFELYDVTGRLGKRIVSLDTNHFVLNRETLASGIYFYRITTVSGKGAYGKVVVE